MLETAARMPSAHVGTAGDGSSTRRTGAPVCSHQEGAPRAILANAIHALRQAPEWRGVLWHNEFATSTVARRPPPWASQRQPGGRAVVGPRRHLVAEWLQQQGIMVPASIAGQAVETVARDQTFHPVREYLDALRWDGQPRLDAWLISYLGAPTPLTSAPSASLADLGGGAVLSSPAARPTAR